MTHSENSHPEKYNEAWLVRNAIIGCTLSLIGISVSMVAKQGVGGTFFSLINLAVTLCFLAMIALVPRKALAINLLGFLVIGKMLLIHFWDNSMLITQAIWLLPPESAAGTIAIMLIVSIFITSTLIHALANQSYPSILQRIIAFVLLLLAISLLFVPTMEGYYFPGSKGWKDNWTIPTFTISIIVYAVIAILHSFRTILYKVMIISSAILVILAICILIYGGFVFYKMTMAHLTLYLISFIILPAGFIILVRCTIVACCVQYTESKS